MSSIFPQGGSNASSAPGSITGLTIGPDGDLAEGCPDLWYRLSCNNEFDPVAANALLSEAVNIMKDRGLQYDCSRSDNLSRAIGPHLISYECRISLPVDPWPVANGDDVITQGSFTIPNNSGRDMQCLLISQLTVLVQTLAPGDDENIHVRMTLSNDNSYDGAAMYSGIRMRRQGSTDYDSWQTVKTGISLIPNGGRTFWYQLKTTASAGASFKLKEDYSGCRFRAFGHSYTTSDIITEVR